jgi:hypothetical protein
LLPQIFEDIDAALCAAAVFLESVIEEENKLFGPEGENAGMTRATRAMCKCFDWSRLTIHGPSSEDVKEFGVLCRMLMPFLKHCQWPDREEFPDVDHGWPSIQALQVQYVLLMSRVRKVKLRMPSLQRNWYENHWVYGDALEALRLSALVCGDYFAPARLVDQSWSISVVSHRSSAVVPNCECHVQLYGRRHFGVAWCRWPTGAAAFLFCVDGLHNACGLSMARSQACAPVETQRAEGMGLPPWAWRRRHYPYKREHRQGRACREGRDRVKLVSCECCN